MGFIVYSIYIFNRDGDCLFLRKFRTESKTDEKELNIEKKNMFGLLFTLKTFVNQITPRELKDQEKEPIHYFQTSQYQLHYMETASGLRFAITTPPETPHMGIALGRIYKLYVDNVLRNPSYKVGTPIRLIKFYQLVESYVKSLQ
mmetsp:Transcript_9555/g.14337  ORF Transcript_9555/g.14337 Transcript_9555/m.14337 type:complete len:145 (+) Transcript_9555:32-466(+)